MFFTFVMGVFGTMFHVAGVNQIDQSDNANKTEQHFLFWVNMLRYSTGDINHRPTYLYWDQDAYRDRWETTFMISLILFIFVILLFIMIIVLLIGETYEDIMSRKIVTTILQKAEMNRECRLVLDALNQDKEVLPFILSSEKVDSNLSSSWQGFVMTIRNNINESSQFTNDRLALIYLNLNRKLDYQVGSLNNRFQIIDMKLEYFQKDLKPGLEKLVKKKGR